MEGEKIEKLIAIVSEYNELYDMKNKNYSNLLRRENIWEEIGKKIEESAEVCKQKWKGLRDGFQRAAKHNITKSGQAAKQQKKWKYWDIMSFLLPHIKGRETHSNISANITQDESIEANDDVIDEDSGSEIIETQHSSGSNLSQSKSVGPSVGKSNKRKKPEMTDLFQEYMDGKKSRRLERQAEATNVSKKNDDNPLLDFFINMGKTASTFPPIWQAKIKSQVFQIVNSAEIELLGGNNSVGQEPPAHVAFTPTHHIPLHTHSYPHHQQHPTAPHNSTPSTSTSSFTTYSYSNNDSVL